MSSDYHPAAPGSIPGVPVPGIGSRIKSPASEWRGSHGAVRPQAPPRPLPGPLAIKWLKAKSEGEKKLLLSECRHHIDEVLLTQLFNALKVENSLSPEVDLFVSLRENWTLLSHEEGGSLS